MIGEGDKVVSRYTIRGTHQGETEDFGPPTGRQVELKGITIHRFEDGNIVEEWEAYDNLGIRSTTVKMKGILLIGGHPVVRQAFAFVLDREPDLKVVGEAGTVAEVYSVEGLGEIGFAFIDWDLSDEEVTDLIGRLREKNSRLWVVAMTPTIDPTVYLRALEAGVDEVVARTDALESVVAAIKRGAGRWVVPPTVAYS
jgi:CheY-like chemotaxis protein